MSQVEGVFQQQPECCGTGGADERMKVAGGNDDAVDESFLLQKSMVLRGRGRLTPTNTICSKSISNPLTSTTADAATRTTQNKTDCEIEVSSEAFASSV